MGFLRRGIVKHLDAIRALIINLHQIDSGLYSVDQVDKLLRQPNAFRRIELDWVHNLQEVLHTIQQFLVVVERWANHVYGLAHNLGATPEESVQIRERYLSGVTVLQTKTLDKDYLDGILAATTHEADNLIQDTQALMQKGVSLIEHARQFGGPFLEQVLEISVAWVALDRSDFYIPLKALFEASRTAKGASDMVEPLGRYLDQIASIVAATPMFVGNTAALTFSDEDLKTSQQIVQHIVTAGGHLHAFIQEHHTVLQHLHEHQVALLRPILPTTTPIPQWITRHNIERATPTDTLLPQSISCELVSVFTDAEGALTAAAAATTSAQDYLNHALPLNTVLQSPAIQHYLTAAQTKVTLYKKCLPSLTDSLTALCNPPKTIV